VTAGAGGDPDQRLDRRLAGHRDIGGFESRRSSQRLAELVQDGPRCRGLDRDFDLVTVAANMPDEKPGVQKMLEKKRATSRNLLFASEDTPALQRAFDPTWESAVPYTVLLDENGKVLYKKLGSVDILELRRTILACLPSDYSGFNKYWQSGSGDTTPAKSGSQ
jgi:hypothetical protein